jgi:hypothetical protein
MAEQSRFGSGAHQADVWQPCAEHIERAEKVRSNMARRCPQALGDKRLKPRKIKRLGEWVPFPPLSLSVQQTPQSPVTSMASPCIRPMRQANREVPAGRGQDDKPGAKPCEMTGGSMCITMAIIHSDMRYGPTTLLRGGYRA